MYNTRNGPQSRAPLKWGEGAKNLTASRHLGCPRNMPKPRKSIGTWNVRSLLMKGKLENVKREMKRYGLNVLGLSEVRWKGRGDFMSDDIRVIYSGGEQHQRGVAILLDKETEKRVTAIEQVNDRIVMVKVDADPVNVVIIQIYMPTSECEEKEIEEMYEKIEELVDKQKGSDNVIVMGDWNAVVGEGREDNVVGQFGLGRRNDRGEKLVEFCKRKDMMITNTWFEKHRRRRYTWKQPGDRNRYQIDYILVRNRYRNSIKNSQSYPGADVNSDHNLVAVKSELKWKKIKVGKRVKKWNVGKLKTNIQQFQDLLESKVRAKDSRTVEERWSDLKTGILDSAEVAVGYNRTKVARKPWVTEEMLLKMDERRKWKNINTEFGRSKYKQLNNEIRRVTEKARDSWWEEQCEELQELDKQGKHDVLYNKVKKLTNCNKKCTKGVGIEDENGVMLTEDEAIRKRWIQYIEVLYDKAGKPARTNLPLENEDEVGMDFKGPDLLESEIRKAISEMKDKKAVGIDAIPSEFLKNLGENSMKELTQLCQVAYERGEWPSDFTKLVLIPLEKKTNAIRCEDYRTISLISHASKILLKVLTRRIEAKAKELIGRSQFGFRKGLGTRDAIGVLKALCERSLEHGNEVYICYVDFEKAFDRVNWVKMLEALKLIGVDWKDRRMIAELYMNQEAIIRVANGESESGIIGRGVRQGCPLSPLLFSIYAEMMMIEAMERVEDGVKVGGEIIKDVRFADDQAMVADSEVGLQNQMDSLARTAEEYDMRINIKKTKTMLISKKAGGSINIFVNGKEIERVRRFKYLGSVISEDGRSLEAVKERIVLAKVAFGKRRELLTKRMSMRLKKKLIKTLIWPVALYGCETWTLRKEEINRLNALEMWLWRRVEKIKWTDKITNEAVLSRVEEERSFVNTVIKRKKAWIGHALRHDSLLMTVLEGRMEGKRCRGRRRIGMLDELIEESYDEMKRRAQNRHAWKCWLPRTCLGAEN